MESTAAGVVGRKAVSSSAVDKLKKKKRKKRKVKEGKRSSASSNSATGSPDSDGRGRFHKSRSALSCPPDINQTDLRKTHGGEGEVGLTYNETLRWLPFIASHSAALPPQVSNAHLYGPTALRLNSNTLTETLEEEEERIAIYKMNRRKRYLAAQQALMDLYPDTNVYATEEPLVRADNRRSAASTSLYSTPSSESTDPSKNATTYELAVPSLVSSQDNACAQEVL